MKLKETTYKLRPGSTVNDLDELDAALARIGILGQPDFSKLTYTINKMKLPFKKARHLDMLMKKLKTKKIHESKNMIKLKSLLSEKEDPCWDDYKQVGMKTKNGKKVPNCVPEAWDVWNETCGYTIEFEKQPMEEAEYQGRKVKLNKPMQGDSAKFKVYVKNDKGNVVKVNFGAKGKKNRIKKSDPGRRASFRARHNCDSPGPRYKARYWSCKKW
jgi:major membrane immunogen (membrane-anchored lipoprotein)